MSIASEFHRHSSWGRTRRPKALKRDGAIAEKETASEVVTVRAGALSGSLDSTAGGSNGYATENQRFLHLQIEDDAGDETLSLYAYNYAFGNWALLYIPVGAGATANATYVAAEFSGINGKKQFVVPIEGVDRIAFVHDGTVDVNFKVRAACTSF